MATLPWLAQSVARCLFRQSVAGRAVCRVECGPSTPDLPGATFADHTVRLEIRRIVFRLCFYDAFVRPETDCRNPWPFSDSGVFRLSDPGFDGAI